MSAGKYDFSIENGSTFRRVLTWKDSAGEPINLTGYTAKMQIRKSVSAADAAATLSSADGTIELGTTNGQIVLNMSAETTEAITLQTGLYDLELTSPSGFVTRLLAGTITFIKGITR